MHNFICKNHNQAWNGYISNFHNQGVHFEFTIQSRTSIMIISGKTSRGYFACMPDFNAGCHLADLCDVSWNTEKLTKVLEKVDGITVAYALKSLAETLKYPKF